MTDKNDNIIKKIESNISYQNSFPEDDHRIQDAADQFIDENIFEINHLNKSDNTSKVYARSIQKFENFLNKPDGLNLNIHDLILFPRAWSAISYGLVYAFQEQLINEGYAFSTINTYLSAIKIHAQWAFIANFLSTDQYTRIQTLPPLAKRREKTKRKQKGIDHIRVGNKKSDPTLLNSKEIDALLNTMQSDSLKDKRDLALFLIFIDLGFRVGEVVGLSLYSLDFYTHQLTVYREKVHKTQKHYLSPRLEEALKVYLHSFPNEKIKDQNAKPLFISLSRNEEYYGTRINTRSIQKIFENKGKEIGLKKPFSPHDLRHSWAIKMGRSGISLKAFQEAGGWNSLQMPMYYMAADDVANQEIRDKVFFEE